MSNNTLNMVYYLQLFLQGVCYNSRVDFVRMRSTTPLKPTLHISCSEAIVCTQDAELAKQETHRHTHTYTLAPTYAVRFLQ